MNDCKPQFVGDSQLKTTISELTLAGTILNLTIKAIDEDVSEIIQNTITYKIDSENANLFDINPETGEIKTSKESVNVFDFEKPDQYPYTIKVVASDGGGLEGIFRRLVIKFQILYV